MKTKFVPQATLEIPFQGEVVEVLCTALTFEQFSEIQPILASFDPETQSYDRTAMITISRDVVAENCEILTPIEDAAGNPLDMKQILAAAFFTPLIIDIVTQMVIQAAPTKGQEKNSDGQPPSPSVAGEAQT